MLRSAHTLLQSQGLLMISIRIREHVIIVYAVGTDQDGCHI